MKNLLIVTLAALLLGLGGGFFIFKKDCPLPAPCICPEVEECEIFIDTCMTEFPPVIKPQPANDRTRNKKKKIDLAETFTIDRFPVEMLNTTQDLKEETEETIAETKPKWGQWWNGKLKEETEGLIKGSTQTEGLTGSSDPLCPYNLYEIQTENEDVIVYSTIETYGTLERWTPSIKLKEPRLIGQKLETVTIEQLPPPKNSISINGGLQFNTLSNYVEPVIGVGYQRNNLRVNYSRTIESKNNQVTAGYNFNF